MLHPRFPFSPIPFCRYVRIHQLLLAPSACQAFTALLFASFFHFFLVIPAAGLWAFLFLFPTVTVEDLLEFSWDVKHLCMGFAVTGSTPTSHSKKIWPCSQRTPVFVRMGKTYDLLLFILH